MPIAEAALKTDQIPEVDLVSGLRVRTDLAFANAKGVEKSGIRKRAERALKQLQAPLHKLLKADETVLCIVRAHAPASLFEQMTMGWYIYRITSTMLVLTNHRILHLACDTRGNWTQSTRTIGWGELSAATARAGLFSGTFSLTLRNGKKIKYWGISRADSQKLQTLASQLMEMPAPGGATSQMPHLCPECFAILTPQVYECGHCGLRFRDESTMTRRSLFIPGGGYFYCGQAFLGLADFLTEGVLSLIVILFVLDAVGNTGSESGGTLTAGIVIGLFLAAEKWLTIHHCRRFIRDFIPVIKKRESHAVSAGMAAGR